MSFLPVQHFATKQEEIMGEKMGMDKAD